jgi:hypothetical protein
MATGILDGSVMYLAGSMEKALDGGVSFREKIKDECKKRGLKIKFLDPTRKISPKLSGDVIQEKTTIQSLKKKRDWTGLQSLMRKIVREDLRSVALSDALILYIDKTFICGSMHELVFATEMEQKPVLVIAACGKEEAPSWLFGIINPNYIFSSIDECIDYLAALNSGEKALGVKWILFRKELDTLID